MVTAIVASADVSGGETVRMTAEPV